MPSIKPRVLTGKNLATATKTALVNTLRPDVMLDRVINVKINYERFVVDDKYMKSEWKAASIIIRSDYEAVGGNVSVNTMDLSRAKDVFNMVGSGKMPHYEKVRIKPDIRVSYKGVGKAGLNFEVTIANFYTFVNNANIALELNTASAGIRIRSIEVLMGYMSQFPDLSQLGSLAGAPDIYSNFKHSAYNNASYITGTVLYWYRSSMPPDAEYTFYCAVAQTTSPVYTDAARLIDTGSDTAADDLNNELYAACFDYASSHQFSLKSILDWYITGHYLRYDMLSTDYKINQRTHTLENESWCRGVQVFIMSYNIRVKRIPNIPFIGLENNVVKMISVLINRLYPKMYYRFGVDGNVYIYDSSEHLDNPKFQSKMNAAYATTEQELLGWEARLKISGDRSPRPDNVKLDEVFIPAIYSLQYGVISQISCPFFGVLNPGQKLLFNASYSVAVDQESAIKIRPPAALTTYNLIYYDVDFGTVSEYNNMNLYCTRR